MRLLFVYGTLKRGYGNNRRLQVESGGSKLLGPAVTCGKFRFLDNGSFPGLCEQEGRFNVRGELYSVSQEVMDSCDRLEGHPSFYRRKRTTVLLDQGEGKIMRKYRAYAYFIQSPFSDHWKEIDDIWPPKQTTKT